MKYTEDIDYNYTHFGVEKSHRVQIFLFPILLILLMGTSIASFVVPIKYNREKSELVSKYEHELKVYKDSMQKELDYSYTLNEICNIHEIYGRLLIAKEYVEPIDRVKAWDFILSLDVWYPEYIMAQSIAESDCGRTSPIGTNNLFGMGIPKHRETTAINKNSNDALAKYRNWKESIIDRVLWELYIFRDEKPTKEEYIRQLEHYAKSPTYMDYVSSIAKKYEKIKD